MPPKSRPSSSLQRNRSQLNEGSKKPQREATVYDAVAGRVSTQRFIPLTPYTSRTRDVPTSSTLPVPPEEVLFRRLGAPERDIHDDFYWADKHLAEKQTLPESDLLKAVHAYAADFYEAMGEKGEVNFRSMDETALLAIGLLLEEAAEEVLGETGDMVFVEGEEAKKPKRRREVQIEAVESEVIDDDQQQQEEEEEGRPAEKKPKEKRKRKKRKIRHEQDDPG